MDPTDVTPNGIANSAEAHPLRVFLKRDGMSLIGKSYPPDLSSEAPRQGESVSNMLPALTCRLRES
jgi:hypothetical protein